MAANIGSVFLGDRQRIRHLSSSTTHSSSTPPSSPPPNGMAGRTSTSPLSHTFDDLGVDLDDAAPSSSSKGNRRSLDAQLKVDLKDLPPEARRKPIDPELALELRVRWLEAIVLGLKQQQQEPGSGGGLYGVGRKGKGKEPTPASLLKHGETLLRLAENVQKQLESAVEGNEGLKKFMDKCMLFLHFLVE